MTRTFEPAISTAASRWSAAAVKERRESTERRNESPGLTRRRLLTASRPAESRRRMQFQLVAALCRVTRDVRADAGVGLDGAIEVERRLLRRPFQQRAVDQLEQRIDALRIALKTLQLQPRAEELLHQRRESHREVCGRLLEEIQLEDLQ
jgi:hypothetical protein